MTKPILILDAMGVIYYEEDDLEKFMPYFLNHSRIYGGGNYVGSIKRSFSSWETIRRIYNNNLTTGKINSKEFFKQIGIDQIGIDHFYLNFLLNFEMDKEFLNFKKKYKENLIILSNDSQEWANYRNRKLNLDVPYFTSSLFGIRKPDKSIYEKICWMLKISPKECIFVDNLESNLENAQFLGMKTILFKRNSPRKNSTYPIVRNFTELDEYLIKRDNKEEIR